MMKRAPRNIASWTIGLILCAAPAWAQPQADEAVERYLARLGVTSVLAERLEHDLAAATGPERARLATRLAEVYAELLAGSSADARTEQWEARARALLESVPEAGSIELELSLARAAYVRAEATAERGILRMAPPQDALVAVRRLSELVAEFDAIADDAHRRVSSLEKQEEHATNRDTTLLTAALVESRRHRSIAHFLAGSAALLVATSNSSAEAAEQALEHFGWILGAKPGARPELDRLAEQNLMYPHVAKAALGTALAHAIRGRADESAAWISAVRSAERLPPDLPELITTREIQSLAAAGQWLDLAGLVAAARAGESASGGDALSRLTVTHARLLAVLALSAPDIAPRQPVAEIRDAALADLVARGELGHVLELATAFGTAGFPDDSFIGLEVRGLKAYDEARAAHGPDDAARAVPPTDPAVQRMYARCAELFESALRTSDAASFPDAAAQTMLLAGVCRMHATAADAASSVDWLVRASDTIHDPGRAATALHLAIHALDAQIERAEGSPGEMVARRDGLIDAFLERFPEHDAAPSLIVRRATRPGVDPARGLAMLLSIPASSPWHASARHHASAIAFDLYRASSSGDHDWAARRYLDLEEPLLAADRRLAAEGRKDAAERAVIRARRMIEAALALDPPDLVVAERALESIDSLGAIGVVEVAPFRGELAYRRAQIALARGDRAAAEALLAEAAAADPSLASAGDRLQYDSAVGAWRSVRREAPDAPATAEAAAAAASAAERLLASGADSMAGPAGAVVRATCAEALQDVFRIRAERSAAERAVELLRAVLEQTPRATAEVRRLAELSEALGYLDESLGAWRTLLAGLSVGSDQWFDARVGHVRVLVRADPARAREVLAQHVTLYPDYGPEPWGPSLRRMHETLGGNR